MKLILESNLLQADQTAHLAARRGRNTAMIAPIVNKDYWLFRVKVSEQQAVLGFPKFTTIGIGFAIEAYDWNTNLPYTVDTDKILNHISVNKGDATIPDALVREAIQMIQQAAAEYKANKNN
jgi:hypothetical protein